MEAGGYKNRNHRNKPKKTQDAKCGKETQRFKTEKHNKQRRGTKNRIVQNDLEYADDTELLIERDTHEQMCERMENYDIATVTSELKIQWIKVELLRHGRNKLAKHYHHLLAK